MTDPREVRLIAIHAADLQEGDVVRAGTVDWAVSEVQLGTAKELGIVLPEAQNDGSPSVQILLHRVVVIATTDGSRITRVDTVFHTMRKAYDDLVTIHHQEIAP